MTALDYLIVVGFLSFMAVAGLWISRLIKTSDDFFVAGRELTPFILAATITATNLSMFHFIGFGGTAYQNGVSIIWQNWTGDIALVLSGIFVLPIMRRLRIRSIPEFLELRYSRPMRTIVGAFWGLRLSIYLGMLMYIAATAAVAITGFNHYGAWLFIFAVVALLYSVIGGAWAVAIMDSVQFLVMVAGALVVFPIAMNLAGGIPGMWHYFQTTNQVQRVTYVPHGGDFNWLFITSMMLLGFKWASIDQAILQRAFGAKSPRVGAKGMIISGIITTPMAFLWILPGLVVTKLHPAPFSDAAHPAGNPDLAIPWLLATYLPTYGRGLLGFVLCGLVAAQVSVVTADVNSVATLITSDVYRTLKSTEPTQKQLLRTVRISSVACGTLMLIVAWLLQYIGVGAVKINLTIVGILDMPLFVVTVIYGLGWRRTNWQGACCGFVAGGILGVACYKFLTPATARNIAPLVSTTAALIFTPIFTLLTRPQTHDRADRIFQAMKANADDGDAQPFGLIPSSLIGKVGAALALLGFVAFITGVLSASVSFSGASMLAVGGMIVVFIGGVIRVCAR
jgi:SSS family solute:Na+ symporter